jgi:hypothetical protein
MTIRVRRFRKPGDWGVVVVSQRADQSGQPTHRRWHRAGYVRRRIHNSGIIRYVASSIRLSFPVNNETNGLTMAASQRHA